METVKDEAGTECMQLTISDAGTAHQFLSYRITELLDQLEPNTQYMLSFDVQSNRAGPTIIALQKNNGKEALTNAVSNNRFVADDEWHRWEIPLTTNSLESIDHSYGQVLYIYIAPFEGTLTFRNIKFEKGNRATSWCPAPEDVTGDVFELTEATAKSFDVVEQYVVDHPKEGWIDIADTTTTKEVSLFEFDTDINGNTFDCKKIIAKGEFPAALGHSKLGLIFETQNQSANIYTNMPSTGVQFVNETEVIKPNLVEFTLTSVEEADYYLPMTGRSGVQIRESTSDIMSITKFVIKAYGEVNKFPIGTRIKVWGVKA